MGTAREPSIYLSMLSDLEKCRSWQMASLVGQSRIEIQARSVVTPGASGTCPLSGTAKRFMMIQDSC